MHSPFCLKDCHKTERVAFGFILLLRSTLIYFGCHRHCLLSASSDNLCKGKSHQIPPCLQMPSLTGEKDLEKMMSRDASSSSAVLLLCSQRRTSRVCRWVPEFSQPPRRRVSLFPIAAALVPAQPHCLSCGISQCHSDAQDAERGHGP